MIESALSATPIDPTGTSPTVSSAEPFPGVPYVPHVPVILGYKEEEFLAAVAAQPHVPPTVNAANGHPIVVAPQPCVPPTSARYHADNRYPTAVFPPPSVPMYGHPAIAPTVPQQ